MVAFIFVSEKESWSSSTSTVDFIAELTRNALAPECEAYLESIYSEFELTQMMTLGELDAVGFQCFCRATRQAFQQFRDLGHQPGWSPEEHEKMVASWSELLTQLAKDRRYALP